MDWLKDHAYLAVWMQAVLTPAAILVAFWSGNAEARARDRQRKQLVEDAYELAQRESAQLDEAAIIAARVLESGGLEGFGIMPEAMEKRLQTIDSLANTAGVPPWLHRELLELRHSVDDSRRIWSAPRAHPRSARQDLECANGSRDQARAALVAIQQRRSLWKRMQT